MLANIHDNKCVLLIYDTPMAIRIIMNHVGGFHILHEHFSMSCIDIVWAHDMHSSIHLYTHTVSLVNICEQDILSNDRFTCWCFGHNFSVLSNIWSLPAKWSQSIPQIWACKATILITSAPSCTPVLLLWHSFQYQCTRATAVSQKILEYNAFQMQK